MGKITLKTPIQNDKYTEYVYGAFDIQDSDFSEVVIDYDLKEAKEFDWNIGLIYGSSGSGKTSLLKRMGTLDVVELDPDKALISNFDWLSPKDATMLLTSMGLSSVPTWLRPYDKLSNGERYRAELAYKVGRAKQGEVVLIDEYTSVVNRDVAKAMSFALQKYVRKKGLKIILASCHYDIVEWLMPDWLCSPQKGGTLERGDCLRHGRPNIELQVSRVEADTWDLFKKHHYLTEKTNKSFGYLLFTWKGNPVGIVVYKPQPNGYIKNSYALSRTVVLPDFQGMGIGSKISEFTAAILKESGKRVFTKTVNPALGEYRNRSDSWRGTSKNGMFRADIKGKNKKYRNTLKRTSYCHEYVGDNVEGYSELLLTVKEMRNNKEKNYELVQ